MVHDPLSIISQDTISVGSKVMKEYFYNKVRTFLLSGSHPPSVAASCLAALRLVDSDRSIVERLWNNTKYFKKGLRDLAFDTGESETPITPIMVGESSVAQDFAREAFNLGVFVLPIVYPMVAKGKARIRTIVTSAHTRQDLDDSLSAFEKVGRKLSII